MATLRPTSDGAARPTFQVGQRASQSRTITETDIVLFAGISGDFNPLHVDAAHARSTRFGGRIAHGMLTASLISPVLGTRLPGPGSIYLGQQLKFLAPVFIGDTVTASVELLSIRNDKPTVTLKTTCHNQRGEKVVGGEAILLVSGAAPPSE
ncbi:MAG: MaoC family dehydratase [Chloroflexi bacterium]|nr:MaoC family dehydratase [Chloroflexota bacterium]